MWHLELLRQGLGSTFEGSIRCHSQHHGRMAAKAEKFSFKAVLRRHEIVKLLSNDLVKAQLRPPPLDKVGIFRHSDLYEP